MSQWTHINAAIRFDGIGGMTPNPDLGKTVDFEDLGTARDTCDVPRGSEGSLQYKLTEVDRIGMTRFVAIIWGDLRDYSNVDELKEYLARITEGHAIRSGIAEINVEYGPTLILCHKQNFENACWEVISEIPYVREEE